MDLKECYAKLEGNYDEILSRFMSDAMVERFMLKFLKDTSFQEVSEALNKNDGETAFRAAHTLKGVALNLSLSKLAVSASELTENLRDLQIDGDTSPLFTQTRKDYAMTKEAIEQYAKENGKEI